MAGDSCATCRFGEVVDVGRARCGWVDRTEDEAGDRMPTWAHEIVREHSDAVGEVTRAEDCAAYEGEG